MAQGMWVLVRQEGSRRSSQQEQEQEQEQQQEEQQEEEQQEEQQEEERHWGRAAGRRCLAAACRACAGTQPAFRPLALARARSRVMPN